MCIIIYSTCNHIIIELFFIIKNYFPYSLANPAFLTAAEMALMAVWSAFNRSVKLPVAPIRFCSERTKRVRVMESTSILSDAMTNSEGHNRLQQRIKPRNNVK